VLEGQIFKHPWMPFTLRANQLHQRQQDRDGCTDHSFDRGAGNDKDHSDTNADEQKYERAQTDQGFTLAL